MNQQRRRSGKSAHKGLENEQTGHGRTQEAQLRRRGLSIPQLFRHVATQHKMDSVLRSSYIHWYPHTYNDAQPTCPVPTACSTPSHALMCFLLQESRAGRTLSVLHGQQGTSELCINAARIQESQCHTPTLSRQFSHLANTTDSIEGRISLSRTAEYS